MGEVKVYQYRVKDPITGRRYGKRQSMQAFSNRWHGWLGFLSLVGALAHASGCSNSVNPNVATQHNDNFRTGAYLAETELTPQRVRARGMKQKYVFPVSAAIGTQPLYVGGVQFNRGTEQQDVADGIFVATLGNRLYALEANTGKPRWCVYLMDSPDEHPTAHCDNLPGPGPNDRKPRGVNSTPVIDVLNHRIYVLFSTKNDWPEWPLGGDCKSIPNPDQFKRLNVAYWLVAIDISDGTELDRTPAAISATFPRSGLPNVVFAAKNQLDRAALLLDNKSIYVAFGSIAGAECRDDYDDYHGWVMKFRADDLIAPPVVFCTSADAAKISSKSGGAGIWQGGGGLSSDPDGNVYFLTGNGVADFKVHVDGHQMGARKVLYGDSFVKLKPAGNKLQPTAFAPDEAKDLDENDADLGSGGAMVIPDSNLVIGGGKTGYMYLLDRSSMQLVQPPITASTNQYDPSKRGDNWEVGPHLHGSPTYWRGPDPVYGNLYVWGEKDFLKLYRYDTQKKRIEEANKVLPDIGGVPYRQGTVKALADTMPGGMLSVSANGNVKRSGIVWATLPESDCTPGVFCPKRPRFPYPGRLYAYDAETLQWLWDVHLFNNLGHWVPPTIANGKVFIGTWTQYERSGDAHLVAYELGPEGGARSGSCDDGESDCTRQYPYQPQPAPMCSSCHDRRTLEARAAKPLSQLAIKPLHERYPNGASIRAVPVAALLQLAPPVRSVQSIVLEGDGEQIYESKEGAGRRLEWHLKGSNADLVQLRRTGATSDTASQAIRVRLSEGQIWSASDGSMIVGKTERIATAPEMDDAPWTLFKVVKSSGRGILSDQNYIQSVYTHAGHAPVTLPKRRGTIVRVPYHAEYRFYRPASPQH